MARHGACRLQLRYRYLAAVSNTRDFQYSHMTYVFSIRINLCSECSVRTDILKIPSYLPFKALCSAIFILFNFSLNFIIFVTLFDKYKRRNTKD